MTQPPRWHRTAVGACHAHGPELQATEAATDNDAAYRRQVLARIFPDAVAAQAAQALYETGHATDALLLAQIEVLRADLLFRHVDGMQLVDRMHAARGTSP
jgi:hypothetical protein